MATTPRARRIVYMPLDDIVGSDGNPKGHDAQGIQTSIDRLGVVEVITLDERTQTIVSGHGRRDALAALAAAGGEPPDGVEVRRGRWFIPVLRGWASIDDHQHDAALVAVNHLVEKGGWQAQPLADMLDQIRSADTDGALLAVTGYNTDDLAAMLETLHPADPPPADTRDPDDVDEPDDEPDPVAQPGDRYQLGPHILVCGDSTTGAIADLMGHEKAALLWTDPPYGVDVVSRIGTQGVPIDGALPGAATIDGDGHDLEALELLLRSALGAALEFVPPGSPWFVTGPPGPNFRVFADVLADLGVWHQTITWVKDAMVFGRSDYHYRHEPIFYGWTPGATHRPPPARTGDSVWEIARPRRSADHPTMKPVALVERSINNHTDPGDIILDPFAGSGTTLIAAHRTGRVARLVEKEPRYVDRILARWHAYTG